MIQRSAVEYPPEQQQALGKARRLAWLTVLYLISMAALLYLVLGSSQTIKALMLETLLSLVPATLFLIIGPMAKWPPNSHFPYGYHRAVSIGFLGSSLAQFALGLYVLYDSALVLIHQVHPTIGAVHLFGETIWLGWLMFPVLLYDAIPPIFIGLAVLSVAKPLNDKVLYAVAGMHKADWLTATAGIIGIAMIGLGFWWADGVAAILISLDIIYDGYRNLDDAVAHLIDKIPTRMGTEQPDPFPDRLTAELERLDWVKQARVRLREEGHVYYGEAFIVPVDERNPLQRIQQAVETAQTLDWRMHDLVATLVDSLEDSGKAAPVREGR